MKVTGASNGRGQWQRPVLQKLDAADAQATTKGSLNDGASNKS